MRDLAEMLAQPGGDTLRLRQGVVVSVQSGPPKTVTVTVGGSDSVAGVRYMASYTPVSSETVWMLQQGPVLLVLGALA